MGWEHRRNVSCSNGQAMLQERVPPGVLDCLCDPDGLQQPFPLHASLLSFISASCAPPPGAQPGQQEWQVWRRQASIGIWARVLTTKARGSAIIQFFTSHGRVSSTGGSPSPALPPLAAPPEAGCPDLAPAPFEPADGRWNLRRSKLGTYVGGKNSSLLEA